VPRCGSIGLIFLIFFDCCFVLIIVFTFRRFLFSILSPSFRALQSDLVPAHVRGKEFGVVQAANNLGSVIGPILGGWLYDLFSNQSLMVGNIEFFGAGIAFAFSGLLAIVAAILLLLFVKIPKIDTDLETKLSLQPQSTS